MTQAGQEMISRICAAQKSIRNDLREVLETATAGEQRRIDVMLWRCAELEQELEIFLYGYLGWRKS